MARSSKAESKRVRRKAKKEQVLYLPLDPELEQIRVLNIAPMLSKGRIVCRFETVSLLSNIEALHAPDFAAVSWCWGKLSQKADILLNGQVTTIPQAAHNTLVGLCLANGHFRVWMDAICINQRDIDERNRQVAIMDVVYSKAKRVLIWLGPGNDLTDAAFTSIDQVLAQLPNEAKDAKSLKKLFWTDDGFAKFSDLPLPSVNWDAISYFYSLPWFSRFWLVQEVMLARPKASFCYAGRRHRSWWRISFVAQWLHHRQYSDARYIGRPLPGVESASLIWRHSSFRRFDLTPLLQMSIQFETTLPVDKVYGALGLWKLSKWAETHQNLQTSLHVDYRQDPIAVYAAATSAAIMERSGRMRELEILYSASTLVPSDEDSAEYRGSSWVPRLDWIINPDYGSPNLMRDFEAGAANGLSHASMDTTVLFETDSSNNPVICVCGVLVDKVLETSSVIDRKLVADNDEFASDIFHCRRIALRIKTDERNFAMAMTCGMGNFGSNGDLTADTDAFMDQYYAFIAACEAVAPEDYLDLPCTERIKLNFQDKSVLWPYYHRVVHGSLHRRFFVTSNGFIGMGPSNMAENDQTCIFLGGSVPFVLRPDGDYWRLIGNVYVHGIMGGDYIRHLQSQDQLWDNSGRFRIR